MKLPRIGISLGDPAGIGPEVTAKALARESLSEQAELAPIGPPSVLAHWGLSGPRAIPAGDLEWSRVQSGQVHAEFGRAALEAVRAGVRLCLAGELDALVTGPIHKRAAQLAGLEFPGHTEFIAALCGHPEVRMLLAGERLRTIHVTTHLALDEACRQVTAARIWPTIQLGNEAMLLLGLRAAAHRRCRAESSRGRGGTVRRRRPPADCACHRAIPCPRTASLRSAASGYGFLAGLAGRV